LKKLIKEAWPFAVIGISANIYVWIDTLILSAMQGEVVVGLYNASYRLITVLLFIQLIFSYTLYPVMSKQFNSSKEALRISFEKGLKILMMVALPIGIGTVLIADKVILLVYGKEFLGSVIALQILIWSTVLVFARTPYGVLLGASRRQLTYTKIIILAVILNIILNLLFIPLYSYVGAGIALIITDSIILVLSIIATRAEFSIKTSTKIDLIKIVIASVIMGISMNYFINLNLFLVILLGSMIYIICLIFRKIKQIQ
jgi:O-antigen/teichoic acid export membrane protein